MSQIWTQSSLSHRTFSTTPPATITSIRTMIPSGQMFGPVTRAAGSQYVQTSVKMCRGQIQQNHLLHNLTLTALANLQAKYKQTLSRSVLPYFHQHQWSYENLRQQRILHQKTTCHPSQNLTLQSTWSKSSLHSPNTKYLFSFALHSALKDNGNHTSQMFRQEDRLSRVWFWCSLQDLNA